MRPLSWRTVAALSIAFVACGVLVFALSLGRAKRERADASSAPNPDDVPFDLADWKTREAFDEYTRFARKDEASLAFQCGWKMDEVYRVEIVVAMDTHPDFALVDVIAGGGRALIDVKTFVTEGTERWRSVRRSPVDAHALDIVRERAANLLSSRVPAVNDRPLDSAEWTVQMCRRGRYHFFQRYAPKRDVPDDVPFIALTDAVMALRRGEEPGT